nr:hypothetical protein [Tanacetum cinerariifolium]
VVVVAAAVVVTTTSPVRFMTVVIMTVVPVTTLLRGRLVPITTPLPLDLRGGRPAKTPLKVLRLLLLGANSCPEESSKSKEALHQLRASF